MFLRRQRHQNIDIFDPKIDTENQNAGTSVTLAPRAVIRAPKHHNTMILTPKYQYTFAREAIHSHWSHFPGLQETLK